MGQTNVTITVHGPQGSTRVETLADTAAAFTRIPGSAARELGLKDTYETSVELGDGRIVTHRLALADIQIQDVRRPLLVAIAEDGERSLLGYTALETLGFKVNPVNHRLEKTAAIES